MSSAAQDRTGLLIITDLYNLTTRMSRQTNDPDFLVESVEKRQALMDEYDAYKADHPDEDITEIKKLVKEIIAMDKKISSSLTYHQNDVKRKLSESQNKQRVMGYGNQGTSSSGSLMNYSK